MVKPRGTRSTEGGARVVKPRDEPVQPSVAQVWWNRAIHRSIGGIAGVVNGDAL